MGKDGRPEGSLARARQGHLDRGRSPAPSGGMSGPPLWDLLLDSGGRSSVAAAQQALGSSSPPRDPNFVVDLLQRYSGWALDLPASQRHHHAFPNGLFRHSVEVASLTVWDLHERWHRGPGCLALTTAEQDQWMKVVFALGLFHDCGKLLDIVVRLFPGGPCWEPLRESLASFKGRQGRELLAPTPFVFRPRRGITGHEQQGSTLIPSILAGQRWTSLRPLLGAALTTYASHDRRSPERHPFPLAYLAERVRWADSSSADRERKKKTEQETGPNVSYVPPSVIPGRAR